MSKKNESAGMEQMESIENALTKAEAFVLKNQKRLTNIVLVALVCAVAVVCIHRYYVVPNRAEAAVQLYPAERYFASDSLQLALNGDGNNMGFLDIIDEYGCTPSGRLACYYAGICQLRLGEYEEALRLLKKYKGKDVMVSSIAIGAMGDAYAELGQTSDAIGCYLKAAAHKVNLETSPLYLFRAAMLYEQGAEYEKALALYQRIETEFPSSAEGREIAKYIARVQRLGNLK